MNRKKTILAILLATVATASFAQTGPTVTGVAPVTAKAGQALTLKVTIDVPDGYHIYGPKDKSGVPTAIAVSVPAGYKASVAYPPAKVSQVLGEKSEVYTGKISVPVKITVPKGAKGKATFKLTVTTQACNDRSCLMPQTTPLTLSTVIK
jgi:DsbC/DsbD-like thiol-disulfide interchange protein